MTDASGNDDAAGGDQAEQTFEYRYQIDYAKSGRSKCKSCKEVLPAGTLRIATLSKSYSFDGTMTQWFHIDCFFKDSSRRVNYPSKEEEVKDFFELRNDDQDKIRQVITQFRDKGVAETKPAKKSKPSGDGVDNKNESSSTAAGKKSSNGDEGGKKSSAKRAASPDGEDGGEGDGEKDEQNFQFQTDYAKSSRAKCKICKEVLPTGTLRIATLAKSYTFDGTMTQWYHTDCFFNDDANLAKYPAKSDDVKGFSELRDDDQQKMKKLIKHFRDKGTGGDAKSSKKLKTSDESSKSSSKNSNGSKTSGGDKEDDRKKSSSSHSTTKSSSGGSKSSGSDQKQSNSRERSGSKSGSKR